MIRSRSSTPLGWLSFGAVLLTAGSIPAASAQQSAHMVSATMLRVLSEAADVYRTGRPVWLVADYRYPHNVLPGFTSRAAAQQAQKDSAANYGIFGPYVTPRDPIPATAPKVSRVQVTIQTSGGEQTQVVDPNKSDALFFSLSAIDKFVLPYYEKTYGAEYALRLRRKILEGLKSDHAYTRHCVSVKCWDPDDLIQVVDPVRGLPQDSIGVVPDTQVTVPR